MTIQGQVTTWQDIVRHFENDPILETRLYISHLDWASTKVVSEIASDFVSYWISEIINYPNHVIPSAYQNGRLLYVFNEGDGAWIVMNLNDAYGGFSDVTDTNLIDDLNERRDILLDLEELIDGILDGDGTGGDGTGGDGDGTGGDGEGTGGGGDGEGTGGGGDGEGTGGGEPTGPGGPLPGPPRDPGGPDGGPARNGLPKYPFLNPKPVDPLVIDLDGDGIELITLDDSTVQFDLDNDGFAELTGWVAGDDAFLAIDLNGNGYIDGSSELFTDTDAFANGFQSLAALDSNGDGVIDQNDAAFADLVLWQDADSDGYTDAGELTSLIDAGIVSLSLSVTTVIETNSGHTISETSSVTWSDGHSTLLGEVWFENDQRFSAYILPEDFTYSTDAIILPVLFGYGHVASSWVVLSQIPALLDDSKALVALANSGDIVGFLSEFEVFMLNWAGVSDVDSSLRGDNVDGQHLAFLEAVYGSKFMQPFLHGDVVATPDPSVIVGAELELLYTEILQNFAIRFIAQSANSGLLLSVMDTGLLPEDDSAVDFLSLLGKSLAPETNSLSGASEDMFVGLLETVANGGLDIENAALLINLLRHDLDDDQGSFDAAFISAANTFDNFEVSESVLYAYQGWNLTTGTDANDVITGSTQNDLLLAGLGDDVIEGGDGADVLSGEGGNDIVHGGDGSDIYIFTRGDGQDVFEDNGHKDTDSLRIIGYNADEVIFRPDPNDINTLVITFVGTTDEIILLRGIGTSNDDGFEQVIFDDGTVWNIDDMRNRMASDQQTDGDDIIFGSRGAETLSGGLGNDTIYGDDGSDTYVFARGDGQDVFEDNGNGGTDTLRIVGYSTNEVIFTPEAVGSNTLVVTFIGTSDQIILANGVGTSNGDSFEQVIFDDGTVWNLDDMRQRMADDQATDGDDAISGSSGGETLSGGLGNDIVHGGNGSDTYIFARGDGQDVFEDNGFNSTDTVRIVGYGTDEVIFKPDALGSNTLVITFVGTSDQITLINSIGNLSSDIFEQVIFDNGTVWNLDDMRQRMVDDQKTSGNDVISGTIGNDDMKGGNGSDLIYGYDGSDTMQGGNGTDFLYGGDGDDILLGGNGQDTATGGQGADIFLFSQMTHSKATSNADHITDFDIGVDSIDLSGVTLGVATYLGDASFSGSALEVRVSVNNNGNSVVRVDVDGDGSADMKIVVDGVTGITVDDFIL